MAKYTIFRICDACFAQAVIAEELDINQTALGAVNGDKI
jgi:hypothetical protein